MPNYYLAYDMYGAPILTNVPYAYVQHGWGGSGKEKANHKYIARIDTPDGYRYFYTQKEIDAYYNKLRKEVDNNRKIYEKQKGKIKVSKNGGKDHVYKSVNELTDFQKNKYSKSIQEMPQRDAQREQWLKKYEAQLSSYNNR